MKKGKGRSEKVSTVKLVHKSQRSYQMYESRAGAAQFLDSEILETVLNDLRSEKPARSALSLIQNTNSTCPVPTKFGPMALGSPVAFKFAHLTHGSKSTQQLMFKMLLRLLKGTFVYPLLPITAVESYIDQCVSIVADEKQIAVSSEKSHEIEAATIGQ